MSIVPVPDSKLVSDQEYRAATILPAAGAYATGAKAEVVPFAEEVEVAASYVRGGAGGSFKMLVWWYLAGDEDTPFGATYRDDAHATVADPIVTVDEFQLVLQGEAAGSAAAVRRLFPLKPPPSAVGVRLDVAEVGAVGTPGTLALRVVSRRG